YLSGFAPGAFPQTLAAFRGGLAETGYAEGQNVAIEYGWADGHYDRLPPLAEDLGGRKVDLIAATGGDLARFASKNASSKIPIVFSVGSDPVEIGLVASLNRPGGNLTGVSLFLVELHAKRLELLTEVLPQMRVVALLVNLNSPQTERVVRAVQEAARVKGLPLHVLKAPAETH